MSLSEIGSLILAFFQFPKLILEFVKLVRKTPQEKHEELITRIQGETKKFEETGRPTWTK